MIAVPQAALIARASSIAVIEELDSPETPGTSQSGIPPTAKPAAGRIPREGCLDQRGGLECAAGRRGAGDSGVVFGASAPGVLPYFESDSPGNTNGSGA